MSPAHRDALIALHGDERVGATLGGVMTPAAVDEHIAQVQGQWQEHGFGWCVFLERGTGDFVARGGPHRTHVAGNDEVEVGWTVTPDRWNQGHVTELGAASIRLAFEALRLPDVVSSTLPHNHASRRAMEKLGFVFERDTDYKGRPHVLFRLKAASARSTSSSLV
jgi:RimJ/RimL family protein N-acetyltransferase